MVDAPIHTLVVHLLHEQSDAFYGDMVIELGILDQYLLVYAGVDSKMM
jgi:hypothetical protein